MDWTSGGSLIAVYLIFAAALACLCPGVIRRQSQDRLASLLRWFCVSNAVIACCLILFDAVAIWALPESVALTFFRRLWARWGWAVLTTWLALALWRVSWPRLARHTVVTMSLLGALLLLGGATTQEARPPTHPILGNRRSFIYHWPGCPNYPRGEVKTPWVGLPSREEAERQGYRAARNCKPESRQP